MKNDEKNNFQNSISEAPDDLTEGEAIARLVDTPPLTERQALIAAIKEEQTRLEWSDANLKRNLQLSFPGRRSTNALSDEELSQFWESLTRAKPLSELKGYGKT